VKPGQQIVGVISDTHGLLRPEVLRIFKGVTLILHAGDIGSPEVLNGLREVAPVVAVRGNNDTDEWAKRIPEVKVVNASGVSIYMLHDVKELKETRSAKKAQVVVSGHSHRPRIEDRDGILFLNPGSAGPRRFKLPISVARMTIHGAVVRAEIIELSTA
jgi:putative phosphoesterase